MMRPAAGAGPALALLLSLAPAAALPQEAPDVFTPDQRDALHDEIRTYLMDNPEILMEMLALLEDRKQAETEAADQALIAAHAGPIFDDGFSFVGGNPEGSVTLVEFLDYQCGYCRRAHPDVVDLLAADGDIRWVVKELPILGPESLEAAQAAIATLMQEGPEAYALVNDALMRLEGPVTPARIDTVLSEAGLDPEAIRTGMDDPEVERRIAETRTLAATLGISGTPTFVLDDRMVRGYLPRPEMEALIAGVRAAE